MLLVGTVLMMISPAFAFSLLPPEKQIIKIQDFGTHAYNITWGLHSTLSYTSAFCTPATFSTAWNSVINGTTADTYVTNGSAQCKSDRSFYGGSDYKFYVRRGFVNFNISLLNIEETINSASLWVNITSGTANQWVAFLFAAVGTTINSNGHKCWNGSSSWIYPGEIIELTDWRKTYYNLSETHYDKWDNGTVSGKFSISFGDTVLNQLRYLANSSEKYINFGFIFLSEDDYITKQPTGYQNEIHMSGCNLRINSQGGTWNRSAYEPTPTSEMKLWYQWLLDSGILMIFWIFGLIVMIITPFIAVKYYGGGDDRLYGFIMFVVMELAGFGLFYAGLILSGG